MTLFRTSVQQTLIRWYSQQSLFLLGPSGINVYIRIIFLKGAWKALRESTASITYPRGRGGTERWVLQTTGVDWITPVATTCYNNKECGILPSVIRLELTQNAMSVGTGSGVDYAERYRSSCSLLPWLCALRQYRVHIATPSPVQRRGNAMCSRKCSRL